MKKRYFVVRGRAGNEYDLIWADENNRHALPDRAERITRAEAYKLARAERDRRRHDPAFAGYACDCIYPADHDGDPNTLTSEDGVLMLYRRYTDNKHRVI